MAALLGKLAITLVLALAWRTAGSPPDAHAVRRRATAALALALLLRGLFALLARATPGAAQTAAALTAELAALALFALLAPLALTGPFQKGGRPTRLMFTLAGVIGLWWASPGTAMFPLWIALTRFGWLDALSTGERFRVSLAALALGLALLLGTPRVEGLSEAASDAQAIARLVRGLGIVYALFAATRAFKAFTTDPTLGIRRVSRRLVLSHVLVVTVPLLIVLVLWVSSTYLGVNADRALLTARTLDREAQRLHETLAVGLGLGPEAGASAVQRLYTPHWPGASLFTVSGDAVTRAAGDSVPGEWLLSGWVSGLDSLPHHGVVQLAGRRYLGAAARDGRSGLVGLVPITEVLDSTLSPWMGASVRMAARVRGSAPPDPSRPDPVAERGAENPLPPGADIRDSAAYERARRVARALGVPDSVLKPERRSRGAFVLTTPADTLTLARNDLGLTGQALAHGLTRDYYSWKPAEFALIARASFHATLAGLFVNVRNNPLQVIPLLVLAGLALLLIPLAITNQRMVRGMGSSITRGITALREGATAYGEGRLAHRIPIGGDDDLWDTARRFNEMAQGLERARELEKERDRLENELELARRIQARLLPAAPPRVAGLDVAGLSESAREVGGDYFDHIDLGDGRLLLVIADVSGKGVPAALLMSGFRASLMSQDLARTAPDQVAARVNDFLHQSVEPGKFVTAFLGVLDAGSGRLVYVNAGHNPPVLLRSGGEAESLAVGGLILGIVPGSEFTSGETSLGPGDLVALYTDGVTEGANGAREQWGEERLLAALRASARSSAREIASGLVREVRAFEGESGPADDITVLVAKRTG